MTRPPTLTSTARGTYRDDHGTPEWIINIHREIHGNRIDLDLASDIEANEIIKAKSYYGFDHPCPPSPAVKLRSKIWCNPPGPSDRVRFFWSAWLYCVAYRLCEGSFLCFSVDHLRMLEFPDRLLQHGALWVGLLRQRPKYATIGAALISTLPPIGNALLDVTWLTWERRA
jgi:hypothetical protein